MAAQAYLRNIGTSVGANTGANRNPPPWLDAWGPYFQARWGKKMMASAPIAGTHLRHVIASTARTAYPGGRVGYELGNGAVAYPVIIVFTLVVVALWRPTTLASFLGCKRSA